ncbi:MAG: Hsp20/alpha crystallin family protein [Candidatus Wenzhouxiangella sp. M2_3B_020]
MKLQNLTPWNWFRTEQDANGDYLPAARPDDPFARMHREMDRMFENFFGAASPAAGQVMLKPSIDIAESKKAYKISVEVPGMDPSDIDLRIEADALVVSGEKKQESDDEDEGFHRVERSYGRFQRVLTLPADADAEHIEADFKKGVVRIRVPRVKEEKQETARRISIEH